ncbi:conserved hypothetical protein [Escherichia coli]|nr:conserved hypothetical protein [Escherichia coli]SOQ66974.1 conserved hypothetical protein [Escherichia coli]SOQ73859.1 conserved hypothetical protein [Escherichia coli]SOQ76313.1 conserved hypothetical protein [Escherichia coli]SOQ80340.1 conserved hypothetical protein [Escherichia coli]
MTVIRLSQRCISLRHNTWAVSWHFNQGYATESVAALFDYLFNEIVFPRQLSPVRGKSYSLACH